jgi:polysaccharide deacetylase family protein (PEP-CTERM system associated)
MRSDPEMTDPQETSNAVTCDLEDWFHILGNDKVPKIDDWARLPSCAERNVDRFLQLFEDTDVRATFFCLGWMAERMPHVVRRCQQAGHEIGSHGYAHIMARPTNRAIFQKDIVRAKKVLEDITGREVVGFRSPGFSVRNDNPWFFDVVAGAGYRYDASVFPAHHGHGGYHGISPAPHMIETVHGRLVEIPASTVSILGYRICFFGGGYLRLSPLSVICWGARHLQSAGRPLIIYVHPREIQPDHPRLPLGLKRGFKSYVNLHTTMPKLTWLCEHWRFTTMNAVAVQVARSVAQRSPGTPAEEGRAELWGWASSGSSAVVPASLAAGERTSEQERKVGDSILPGRYDPT